MNEMNQKVFVKKDELGNVIRLSSNPDYGYVLLEQSRITIKNNWANNKKFTTLLHGTLEDLKAMDFENVEYLSGNIVVRESVIPFDSDNPNRNIKIAGDTGIILCNENGEPIYRKTVYDPSGTMIDELVPHANGDEIKAVLKENKKSYEDMAVESLAEDKKEDDESQLNMFSDDDMDDVAIDSLSDTPKHDSNIDKCFVEEMVEQTIKDEDEDIDFEMQEYEGDDTIFSLEG